ncbi:SAMD9 [Mytilus edulis]|uniref:SAMD9 n=1 Tax=Mytilus edulis TaxID=6550 RepID=A0A8S3RF45_MYTED|nr:SAMD9 [Mytilus edulis]
MRCLKFIKVINFHAVFDFDDESNMNGICAAHRNEERSILQDEEIFYDLSGSKLDLASKLGIPDDNKTVWIFCNGRKDIKPCKPCKKSEKWTQDYSAGIRDAVIFFSQKDIIPKGRALVIVLLFSNNFDGIIETIRELSIRFGWGANGYNCN